MFGESSNENKQNQFEQLYEYIKAQKKLMVIDNTLYDLDEGNSFYRKLLNKPQELLAINSMVKKNIRDRVSPKTIDNILKKVKMDPDFVTKSKNINPQEYIHLENGILDLSESLEYLENRNTSEYNGFKFIVKNNIDIYPKFTYMLNFQYISEISKKIQKKSKGLLQPSDEDYLEILYQECPNFKKYVETSLEGDKEKVVLLLQSMAYLCTNLTQARKAFVYLGKTASGKSIIAKFLIEIIGEEHVSSIPINKLGDRFNIGELGKYKVNIATELSRSTIKNADILKSAISGDRVFGDRKGIEGIHFSPKVKILQLANYLPNISEIDDSGAFNDRLVVILFNKTIPPEKRDKNLLSKLLLERDAIMTVAFLLFERVIKQNFLFKQPKESIEFLENYGNTAIKDIKSFIADRCIISKENKEFTTILYENYKTYCYDNFLDFCSRKDFIYILDELGYERVRFRKGGKNCRGYKGLEIKENI